MADVDEIRAQLEAAQEQKRQAEASIADAQEQAEQLRAEAEALENQSS